jgi:hypothetical protein
MAEVLLNDLCVRSGGQQEARGRVPQRVQVDVAQPGAMRERLEPSEHVARFQRCPDLGGEDEVAVPPCLCSRELFRGLLDPVRAQYLDRRLGSGRRRTEASEVIDQPALQTA